MNEVRKGAELDVRVEKLAFGGKALARVEGFIIFMDHAVPGQKVRVRITRKKRQYAEAQVIQVLEQSPDYVQPFCRHFGTCGGCLWQDIPYDLQLQWKRQHVLDCLEHLAGVEEARVEPTIPSPEIMWYRNKMEFTFAERRWLSPEEIASKDVLYDRKFALGLHVRGFFDKVFNVEECFLESPGAVEILKAARRWCQDSGIPPYNTREYRGFWRFLVIREGKRTNQTLVHLLTTASEGATDAVDALCEHLKANFPGITTFVHSVNQKKAQVAFGESSRVLFGPGYIEEKLGDCTFRISSHSFFQTNSQGAEKLYETVSRFGDFTGGEVVWDLYCGTGSIALYIASKVKSVLGFEVIHEAIDDANVNCGLNAVDNCFFRVGDLKDTIRDAYSTARAGEMPDVIITDPPRAGMHPDVVDAILEIAPKRIVAVSCNPSTLARDLTALLERYEIRDVQPLDLFPHTPHIECVVKLEKRS